MTGMLDQYGPWALVTGASSGFGAEFARQLASRKMNLVLVARRKEAMDELAEELRAAHSVEVRVVPTDLSTPDFLDDLLPQLEGLEIGLLINNAGYTMTGAVLDLDRAAQARMVDLNCRAPLLLAHAVAPAMKARGRGGIVFTSSVMAFGGAAGWATYNATKSFDLILAEGLAAELAPHGVHVQALCPGGTRTGFGDAGGVDTDGMGAVASFFFVMDAPPVVHESLAKLRHRVVIPGWVNWLNAFSMRFTPRRLVTKILGIIVGRLAKAH